MKIPNVGDIYITRRVKSTAKVRQVRIVSVYFAGQNYWIEFQDVISGRSSTIHIDRLYRTPIRYTFYKNGLEVPRVCDRLPTGLANEQINKGNN